MARDLKPEYATALEKIEVEGQPMREFAVTHGLSANNAGVRIHRARRALRRELEATCGSCLTSGGQPCTCPRVDGGLP